MVHRSDTAKVSRGKKAESHSSFLLSNLPPRSLLQSNSSSISTSRPTANTMTFIKVVFTLFFATVALALPFTVPGETPSYSGGRVNGCSGGGGPYVER